MQLNEQSFKTQFIASFLSNWCVNNFDNYCSRNKQHLLEKPPVEDAAFLAACAWNEYIDKFPTEATII